MQKIHELSLEEIKRQEALADPSNPDLMRKSIWSYFFIEYAINSDDSQQKGNG